MAHCGVLYSTWNGDGSQELTALPLEEVKARVQIVDVTAKVTLTQKFFNPSPTATGRAKYCFPVPASAAICGFQMICSDGRTIKGECKAKEEARDAYEQAVASGRMAGLVDYVTDDVFVMSVGAFPPKAVIETRVVYVLPLYTGDYVDQVQFHLPKHVGERYGRPPPGLEGALQPSLAETRVSVTVDIQMYGRINQITSPTHGDAISETKYSTHLGRPSKRRTTIRYHSSQYLERDFVLCIFAQGLDKLRCFAEVRRDPRNILPDSLALQLTLVPRHKLPAVRSQEYIFLIDRSGSMQGERIRIAREVLVMMLRMIPADASTFNIFGFGSTVTPCFSQSQRYSQSTLEVATKCATSMEADLGGTEICAALEMVASACAQTQVPTVVFVLTDGDAWDQITQCQDVARRFVARTNAPRRIFTLGIGDSVSTAMCEGIASAGNGECLLAVEPSSIVQKCAKLFTAGRTPFLRDISMDWGIPDEGAPFSPPVVSFTSQPSPKAVPTRPLPNIQQAPYSINSIHSGTRMTVFALLHSKKLRTPQSVTLSGVLDDETRTNFQFAVDVHEVSLLQTDNQKIPMVHTMAAWKLAQQYNDNSAPLPEPIGGATLEELRHSVVTQLGIEYQLVTPYTSFVAVDGLEDTQSGKKLETSFMSRHPELVPDVDEPPEAETDAVSTGAMILNSITSIPAVLTSTLGALALKLTGGVSSLYSIVTGGSGGNEMPLLPPGTPVNPPADSWRDTSDFEADHASDSARDSFPPDDFGSDSSSTRSLSSLSSFRSWNSSRSDWSSGSSYVSDDIRPIPSSPALVAQEIGSSGQRKRSPTPDDHVSPPVPDNVVKLVQFQHFDGSFSMNPDIESILGPSLTQARQGLTRDEQAVWTTVCCIAYLKTLLRDNPELLDNLLIKPMDFLQSKRNIEIDRLLEHALSLL